MLLPAPPFLHTVQSPIKKWCSPQWAHLPISTDYDNQGTPPQAFSGVHLPHDPRFCQMSSDSLQNLLSPPLTASQPRNPTQAGGVTDLGPQSALSAIFCGLLGHGVTSLGRGNVTLPAGFSHRDVHSGAAGILAQTANNPRDKQNEARLKFIKKRTGELERCLSE